MAKHYTVEIIEESHGVVELRTSFGAPAENPEIIRDAVAAIRELNLTGGKLVKFNGPVSVLVAVVLAHEVAHKFEALAWRDPKLSPGYVVCITHDPEFPNWGSNWSNRSSPRGFPWDCDSSESAR